MSNPLQSKFQVVTSTLLPHKCIACGSEADGAKEFMDFGVSIDYEGAVYLCLNCCKQIANTIGFTAPFERDHALLELTRCQDELAEVRKRVQSYSDLLVSYHLPLSDGGSDSLSESGLRSDSKKAESLFGD